MRQNFSEKWGRVLLHRGKGYFISNEEREERIQIYLYNYVHYDMLYRHRHTVNISRTDRYRVFQAGENLTFSVQLRKVPRGEYRIQCYKITREQGSPYDCWAAMGAPGGNDIGREGNDMSQCRSGVPCLAGNGGRGTGSFCSGTFEGT